MVSCRKHKNPSLLLNKQVRSNLAVVGWFDMLERANGAMRLLGLRTFERMAKWTKLHDHLCIYTTTL